jgi:hypothetical protein
MVYQFTPAWQFHAISVGKIMMNQQIAVYPVYPIFRHPFPAAEIQLNHWSQDTPLHFANCYQQIDTVELLLKARAGDEEGEGLGWQDISRMILARLALPTDGGRGSVQCWYLE